MGKMYNILIATMGMNIGGAETHIVELAKGLKNKGFNIIVASNGGVYEQELIQNGIKHIKVPLHNKKIYNLIYSFFMLRRIIKEQKIDLVHAHARIPAFILALIHKTMKFPFVTTAHWIFETGKGLKYITEWGEKTIAVSEDLKFYLINNYNISPKRISITINGINTDKFSASTDYSDIIREFNINPNNKHLVSISRLDGQTSQPAIQLIQMMPEIDKKIENIDLIIVGTGTKFSKIKERAMLVNNMLGREAVILTGGRTDVNKFAVLSYLFIGISRSALEAMSCKKPVILAGDIGYMGLFTPDKLDVAVLNNFTCRDASPLDYETFKNDVISFLKNFSQDKIDEIAEYGKNIVYKYYSVERMINDNAKIYIDRLESPEEFLIQTKLKDNYDIIISGYYGTRNSGDNAILRAVIDNLKSENPEVKILALSQNPIETKEEYGVDSVERLRFFKIIKIMSKSKLFVYGGGSIIQDLSSTRSILYYLAMIYLAKKMSLKVMLYANGIGPIYKKMNRIITSKVINMVDVISLRDDLAKKELLLLGVDRPEIYVSVDPALSIKDVKPFNMERLKYIEKIHGDGPYIGISVTKLKRCPHIESAMVSLCDYINNKINGTLVFIPMYYSKDMPVIQSISKKMKTNSYVLKNHYVLDEMLGIIQNFDFIIGMRLHSLIYAAGRGIPMLGIAYDPKVKGFLQSINQVCIDDIDKMNSENLIEEFDKAWRKRDEAAVEIEALTAELKKKAKIDVDTVMKLIRE